LTGNVAQLVAERRGESRVVRVEALALAVAKHHRVDRVDGPRLLGELVEQRQHRLLARVGDVEPVESRTLRRFDQPRKIADRVSALREIDELVAERQPVVARLRFVQRGSAIPGFLAIRRAEWVLFFIADMVSPAGTPSLAAPPRFARLSAKGERRSRAFGRIHGKEAAAGQARLIAGLEKGLRIIEAFNDTHPRLTPSTAAWRTGITRTAARATATLHHLGYVESNGRCSG